MTVTLPKLDAAVVVPGFLSGASDFREMADSLSARGIRTAVVPMAAWHWLPCLGGRSMRPLLERIDHTVRHLAAAEGDPAAVPGFEYSWQDCLTDFVHTPGGIWEVGGSAEVQEYPIVEPRGHFPEAGAARGRVALIGHSAGGWISRVYLSKRRYGGRAYDGSQLVHSLVTLGAPLADSSGPAFRGVAWANQEPPPSTVRCLAVGATGTPGGSSGRLTRDAYSFCVDGGDGTKLDGDGVTPTFSALSLPGAETRVLDGVTHFPWGDVPGAGLVAPDLAKEHRAGKPWYGSPSAMEQWADWLHRA
mmetsp:Transcript_36388/g.114481  ORF Transcript_36388/g.114481 Transcript_36388/m.114481 type:complete len:304 (-) Transcript_36388:309-1220(-)